MVNINQFKTCKRAAARTDKQLLINSTENSKAKMASDCMAYQGMPSKVKCSDTECKCKWHFPVEYGQAIVEDDGNYDMKN